MQLEMTKILNWAKLHSLSLSAIPISGGELLASRRPELTLSGHGRNGLLTPSALLHVDFPASRLNRKVSRF